MQAVFNAPMTLSGELIRIKKSISNKVGITQVFLQQISALHIVKVSFTYCKI
jgi:hypothetical protein